jgi:predicted RNase H-like HicB family nuclease
MAEPVEWTHTENTYRSEVVLIPEEDGRYSVLALDFPGCGSCGDTVEEAMEMIRDAAEGWLACYLDRGETPPPLSERWLAEKEQTIASLPFGSLRRVIYVEVPHD